MKMKPILIFPSGMPRSLEYLHTCQRNGTNVIGASSLEFDVSRDQYPSWLHLPYVTDIHFDEALSDVIASHDIGGIFTPNLVVWEYLHKKLQSISLDVSLVNASPLENEVSPYKRAINLGSEAYSCPLALAALDAPKISASHLELAALFRHADCTPGMCDNEKIRALCDVFRYLPRGDLVEIGSWWGKSAFVINQLSSYYKIGNLLCVDPWANENIIQHDESGLVDKVKVDADEALTIFQINLYPYANNSLNYLRLPSVDASKYYRGSRVVNTTCFGKTTYSGSIALLHIDGNHSYANAKADLDSWVDLVVPHGWIIIDDYIWPYGNGPKLVGDQFLIANFHKIEIAFVMGGALFIRLV